MHPNSSDVQAQSVKDADEPLLRQAHGLETVVGSAIDTRLDSQESSVPGHPAAAETGGEALTASLEAPSFLNGAAIAIQPSQDHPESIAPSWRCLLAEMILLRIAPMGNPGQRSDAWPNYLL